jgi:hypothetical protein
MTFTIGALIAANAALEAAAAPLLNAYDEILYQNDALACLLDRDDHSDFATTIRTARLRLLCECVTVIELALEHARIKVAEAHQVEVEHVLPVGELLRTGARS